MFRFAAFRAIREPLLNSYTRTAFVNAAWTRSWIQGRSYTPGSQSREQKYDPRDKKKDTKEKVIEPVTPRYQPKESKNEIKGPKHDILFFGTDKFSAEHLKAVIQERDRPGSRIGKLALVCPPDRYTGRKQKDITPCETKAMASLFDIPVYHTPADKDLSKLKIPETYTLGVVVSFGQFIPPDIINSFKDGAINVHPSLLPKYRGAAPIQHTILAGESETGVTVQELHEKVFDGGRILLQRKMDISGIAAPTYKYLEKKLSEMGCTVLIKTLQNYESFKENAVAQNPELIISAPKIQPDWAQVDFNQMAAWQIEQLHRAIGTQRPLECVFTFTRIKRSKKVKQRYVAMKMFHIYLPHDSPLYRFTESPTPGMFAYEEKSSSIHVCCSDGNAVAFTHLQADSKNIISSRDFLNGYNIYDNVGQFGILSEDEVTPGMSGVRVNKKRSEYNKVIRKRLRMRKREFNNNYYNRD